MYVCPMNMENVRAQMRKGVLELCILRVLGRGEAYASDLLNDLRKADMLVVEGTLYPLLTRMKNAGWLDYRWEESKSGPPPESTTASQTRVRSSYRTWTGNGLHLPTPLPLYRSDSI